TYQLWREGQGDGTKAGGRSSLKLECPDIHGLVDDTRVSVEIGRRQRNWGAIVARVNGRRSSLQMVIVHCRIYEQWIRGDVSIGSCLVHTDAPIGCSAGRENIICHKMWGHSVIEITAKCRNDSRYAHDRVILKYRV